MCRLGMEEMIEAQQSNKQEAATKDLECEVCGRKFRRESDKKRHKCVEERRKPVSQQRGAIKCEVCKKTHVGLQGPRDHHWIQLL